MTQALLGYYDFDTLRLRYRANAAPAAMGAYILYEYDREPGKAYRDDVPELATFTTDWTEVTAEGDPVGGSGGGCKVTGGGVWLRASATSLVKGSLYMRFLVARASSGQEECLCCGYIYDAKPFLTIGEHEHVHQSEATAILDVTYTQANVAGGAVVLDVTPGAGSAFELIAMRVENGGTNSITVRQTDSANAELIRYAAVASGAATTLNLPQVSTALTSASSAASYKLIVAGTNRFTALQGGAGAQNDTLRLAMIIQVKGALPTISKARSTNQADVTATSGNAFFVFIA